MDKREQVARGVWDTLGADYTFDEAVSGEEQATHAEAVRWVYAVADAAIAALTQEE